VTGEVPSEGLVGSTCGPDSALSHLHMDHLGEGWRVGPGGASWVIGYQVVIGYACILCS
jgi:hypothetical protein